MLVIDFEPCNIYYGLKYTGCASDEEIEGFVQYVITNVLYFTAYTIFIDSAFDATAQNPVVPVLTTIRSTFTTKRGSEVVLPLNRYLI